MDKQEYIEKELLKLLQSWGAIALSYGAALILLLCILDYFVTPENFLIFLLYRLIAASLFVTLFVLNKRKISKHFQTSIFILGTAISSIMVELMILSFGGHQSTYYAGIIIILMFVLGFLPLSSIKTTILLAVLTYSIYLLPILIFDSITNIRIFINNNIFLSAAIIIGIVWRHYNDNLLRKKLSLEYDLSNEKEQLKVYSTQLEDLVQERTKELTISEKWHRSIFDNATDGIVVLDKNGVIVNVNRKACEIHGFDKDALIGVNVELLDSKGNKENYQERMSSILNGASIIYETEHYRKDGSKVLLEVSSKAINIGGETYIQSFYRDITEKKKIQEQLMQSQKMESVGALAGGIAHNFNNILTAILGYAELLLEFSNLDDTSKQRVRHIESSARKAGVMVSKLLSFARREAHEVLPLSLNDVINDSVKLFEGVLDKRIGLKVTLRNNIPFIEGDPNQLEQVIMNLMVNARDAMPDGGLITITTDMIEVGSSNMDMPAYIVPGRYIVLTASDTGSGIPQEIINKIFDPFFTTKEKGKGTGLGLATVYGIVKDHKGYISVQSEVGKGTSFDIYLPVSEKTAPKAVKPQIFSLEGHENILVVDDDKDVLNYIKDILETHGYSVMPVNNPLTAIDVFKTVSGKIHLIITDIMMPLMEGNEMIKNLKKIKPDIKIIVVSGYSDETVNKDRLIDAFLKKPFERLELLSTVRRLLDTGIRNLPLY